VGVRPALLFLQLAAAPPAGPARQGRTFPALPAREPLLDVSFEDFVGPEVEARQLLTAAMTAVAASASSCLQELSLNVECRVLGCAGWPAGLTALTSLDLCNMSGAVQLSSAVRGLGGLRELSLIALEGVREAQNLPPIITHLLWGESEGFIPEEVS